MTFDEWWNDYNTKNRISATPMRTGLARIAWDAAMAARPEDATRKALHEVLDHMGALNKPWELEGHGIPSRRAEEICELAEPPPMNSRSES